MATTDMVRKEGRAAVLLSRGELGPSLTQCCLGWGILPYQVASSSIQPFSHNRHGPKTGGCAPFREELRPHLTQRLLVCGLSLYQVASWSTSLLATIDMGRKFGGSAPFFGRELGPHLTQRCSDADLPTKWHLDLSSHLATTYMDWKLAAVPLRGRGSWIPV